MKIRLAVRENRFGEEVSEHLMYRLLVKLRSGVVKYRPYFAVYTECREAYIDRQNIVLYLYNRNEPVVIDREYYEITIFAG